jgi:hypothetical protein
MPRQSIEARAAAVWRAGAVMPEPPKYLSKRDKSLWVDIVSSRPPDWFDPSSRQLLAMYAVVVGMGIDLAAKIAASRSKPEAERQVARLEARYLRVATTAALLMVRLRLTPQARIDRKSGMLSERGSPLHPLLGGKDH